MCACLDLEHVLPCADDGRTVSTVKHDTSQEYERFLPLVSEQELREHVRQRVPALMSTSALDI